MHPGKRERHNINSVRRLTDSCMSPPAPLSAKAAHFLENEYPGWPGRTGDEGE